MKKRTIILSILFLIVGTALGLAENNINLNVKFDQIYGLSKGDQLIYELNHIGDVKSVFYGSDGIYKVSVTIKNNFANAVTEYSKFFIIDDPLKEGNKAIEVILEQTGGIPLKDGESVDGSSNRYAVLKKLEIDIEKGLENLQREYENFRNQVDKIPESKEYKKLKKKLADLVEQLKLASEEANKKIQEKMIPKIIKELDRLEEMLREFNEEKQTKPSEDQVDEPTKI
jgi:hypothetical protein